MAKMTMMTIAETINDNNNVKYTENGAVAYATSGKALVDLNFRAPSMRKRIGADDIDLFVKALKEDEHYAIKWMLYLRDIRGGLGERDTFIQMYNIFAQYDIESAIKCLVLLPEFGRWKDVVDLAFLCQNMAISKNCFDFIAKQFAEDIKNFAEGKSISLLAKWMPSINASQKSRDEAKVLANALGLTHQQYRKALAGLRKHLDVTEVKTCNDEWSAIDYNKVSSNANLRYHKSFLKHDAERRKEYLEALKSGSTEVKMHAQDLTPCEIWHNYAGNAGDYYWHASQVQENTALEEMWKNLKQYDCTGDTLCVVDGSGSMCMNIGTGSIQAIDVARSLGVYFSEHNNGAFKNEFITFSSRPEIVSLDACKTLAAKINKCAGYNDCSNTDIEAVFKLILRTAVRQHMSQEDIPSRILIVSDMEFDGATTRGWSYDYSSLFSEIGHEYAQYGYTLPKLVFWNVNSRTNAIPLAQNKAGVILVSGYSVNILKMVMSDQADPWLALKEALDAERYKVVDDILA